MTTREDLGESAGALHSPIADVLARVAHELRRLSDRLAHVETVVGPLVREAAPRDADLVRRIQDLDHVRQKVGCLGDFLAALARAAPDACLVDAAAAARFVTLADLAARLSLREGGGSPVGARGECELL